MAEPVYPIFKKVVGCLATIAILAFTNQSLSAEFYGDEYGFSVSGVPQGATSMRVTGPRGFAVESDSMSYSGDQRLPNGSYKYEIHGAIANSQSEVDVKLHMNQGRSASARPGKATGVVASGHFRIVNGEYHSARKETEPENKGGKK